MACSQAHRLRALRPGWCSRCAGTPTAPRQAPTADGGSDGTLKSELPEQYQNGISVGLTSNTPPLIFKNDAGEDVGMDREIIEALEPIIGVPLNWESVVFQDMLLGLESGKYDFVVATTINNPRKEKFDQLQYFTSSTSFGSLASAPDVGEELGHVRQPSASSPAANHPFVEVLNPGRRGPARADDEPVPELTRCNVASGNVELALRSARSAS